MYIFVYYESIKRELNQKLIFDSRCDARLKAKAEGCTRLAYTVFIMNRESEIGCLKLETFLFYTLFGLIKAFLCGIFV